MVRRIVFIQGLFFVRWGAPHAEGCDFVRQTFAEGKGEDRLYHIAVFSEDTPILDAGQRQAIVELIRDMLGSCSHVTAVVEARGASGAVLRSALSVARSLEARRCGLSIVDSLDRAVRWAPGPLPSAAELEPIFFEEPPLALQVA